MKKKLTGFLMCLVMLCMTLFAGCNLIETDNGRYYNAVVSEIKNQEGKVVAQITNKDLLMAYQSYGYNFIQYYDYTNAEAVDATLRLLEDRKISVMTAEKMFTLSNIEKTYLWEATASSLQSNLDSYYDEIAEKEETEESGNDNVKFEGYEKNAELKIVDGKYVVSRIDKHDGLLENYTPSVSDKDIEKEEDKLLIYQNLLDSLYNSDYQKAFNTYLKNLKLSEQGQKLSTDTKSVFLREIERLYKINYENLMVEKYSEYFKSQQTGTDVTAKNILDLYSSKVRAQYTQYVFENDSNYDTNVKDNLNDVYYIKMDSESTKYFTVANILFQFTEAQQAQYKAYTTKYESQNGSGYTYDQYQNDINALYSQIQPVVRQKNEVTGEYEEIEAGNLNVDDIIYNEIQIDLEASQKLSSDDVGDTINKYIYKYNQDPGMLNAKSNYVIGVKDGKAVSNFVESFNEAGLKLYNNNAEIGDIEIAKSEYGIHVLVYTGKCQNIFDTADIDGDFQLSDSIDSDAILKLYNTRVNPLVDKTYFDVLYDEIYQDKFSYFEEENLKFLRKDYQITVYTDKIPTSLLENN